MNCKLVSVVIPTFNSSSTIERAVNSVRILKEVGEITIVDDGSTDNTLEKCLSLSSFDPRIKVFCHFNNVNKGVSETRNLGIKNSTLPYVSFLDSDDVFLPNRFKESIDLLEKNKLIDACFGLVTMINTVSNKEKLLGFIQKRNFESTLSYLLKGGYFHTNSVLIRRDFLLKFGLFDIDLRIHEDVELWIRLSYNGNVVSIKEPNPIAVYHYQDNSLIKNSSRYTRVLLWNKVFKYLFFKSIGPRNRILLLKQILKSYLVY
jgi:glycosyltransferase involved in cell wall biosynthesis